MGDAVIVACGRTKSNWQSQGHPLPRQLKLSTENSLHSTPPRHPPQRIPTGSLSGTDIGWLPSLACSSCRVPPGAVKDLPDSRADQCSSMAADALKRELARMIPRQRSEFAVGLVSFPADGAIPA